MLEQRENRGTSDLQTVELRADANGQRWIEGYGIVFNSPSENMGFIETIDPGSVDKTLNEADVRSCGNHDTSWLLGRVKSGTLFLTKDNVGVRYRIPVNEKDPDHQRAAAKVERGDWDGSSFSFETIQDRWNWDANPPERRILEMRLVTIEPVTFPAYPDSTVQMSRAKAALSRIARTLGHPVDRMMDALRSGEIRSLINTEAPVDETTEAPAAVEERAVWTTAYINDLPDSAFLYVEAGGDKDAEGKTTPRSLRHFPYKNADGQVDLPHLRNALARIPDSNLPADVKDSVTAKAKRILADNGGEQNSQTMADTEERVGKTISNATASKIRAAMDMLAGMLEEMEPDTEPDHDVDDMMQGRSTEHPAAVPMMQMLQARVRARQRELEHIQQTTKL